MESITIDDVKEFEQTLTDGKVSSNEQVHQVIEISSRLLRCYKIDMKKKSVHFLNLAVEFVEKIFEDPDMTDLYEKLIKRRAGAAKESYDD